MLLFLLLIIAAITSARHGDGSSAGSRHLESGGINRTRCSESERRALLAIKSDMHGSGRWLSSWKGDDCCNWRGVACDNITDRVVQLDLHYPNRKGDDDHRKPVSKVNPSLLDLKHLKHLDLSMNDFAGVHIPEMLASLVHLEYLNLSNTMFGGSVLPQLGNLSSLHYLDLSNCGCSSRYEDSRACPQLQDNDLDWLSRIHSLEYLDMSCVDISRATSWLRQINSVPSLRVLRLGNARLPHVSSPPPSFNLNSISALDLSGYRKLSTAVLIWLSNASSLEYLHLQHSYFGPHMDLEPLQVALGSLPNLLSLILSKCRMSGDISGIVRNVSRRLMHLDLSSNSLSGYIPSSLWGHGNLEYLDLSDNKFGGRIPQKLGNLTSLKHLNLNVNEIFGEIPVTVGNLTNLVYLRMGANNFSGHIPETLGNLINLERLGLCGNNISGEIPETLANLKNLQILWLCENSIHGQIPAVIGRLYNLKNLDVSDNLLSGQIPWRMGNLTNLVYLELSSNNINGQITESLSNLIHLEVLSLWSNNISGEIPETLANLKNLKTLWLSQNSIHGQIPAVIGGLYNLQSLDVSGNILSGQIPWGMGNLTNLVYLELSSNNINGQIPESLSNLIHLEVLSLWRNNISGEIPETLANLKNLKILYLSVNSIHGQIPTVIGELYNLQLVDLSSNSLAGNITEAHFSKLSSLQFLDLSYNYLSIILPNDWFPPFNAYYIALASCQLQPVTTFPSWIRTQTNLEHLIINGVGLTGELPSWFSDVNFIFCNTTLRILDLSNNSLTGNIPECHTSFPTSLLALWLYNNSFSGLIPPFLQYCTRLEILDLSKNKFSGEAPRWLGESLSSLMALCLGSNGLHGTIPWSIGNLTSLQVLDLSSNNFSGGIPSSLGHLRAMVVSQNDYKGIYSYNGYVYYNGVFITAKGSSNYYIISQVTIIDLSNNNLSGEIPNELTNLAALHFLNLSRNNITGSIPQEIGTMQQLESLDLSMNDLNGEIPLSLSVLNFLSILNLSRNNLSGRIPTGRQLSTLNDPSIYAGNEGLCGEPLPACRGDATVQVSEQDQRGNSDEIERIIDWSVTILGFVTGFWSFVGVLITRDAARAALFKLSDEACNRINTLFLFIYIRIRSWF